MKKKILVSALSAALSLLFISPMSVSAYISYKGYTYNRFNRPVESAVVYEPERTVFTDKEKKLSFAGTTDMFIDKNGQFYLIGESNQITVMDHNFKLVKSIAEFKDKEGQSYTLNKPQGICVKDDLLYIADTDNNTVVVVDMNGNIKMKIQKPDSELYPAESDFKPLKVTVDSANNVYVIVLGLFQGAVSFNRDGEFIEFYGANRVEGTVAVLNNLIWKKFMTKEQKASLERFVPIEYVSFDVDPDDFIYTCTSKSASSTGELRKLNPVGNNVWQSGDNFGDLEVATIKGVYQDTGFVDVAVDDSGFVYGLDETRCRIFQYDNDSSLVSIFGGKGESVGTFISPTAIDTYQKNVYVLDSIMGSITEFRLTEYGDLVYQAVLMFNQGMYDESKDIWEQVVRSDNNNYLGYIGIGKSLLHSGDYQKAMQYFELGNSRKSESTAFEEHRKEVMRDRFNFIITLVLVVIILLVIISKRKKIALFFKRRTTK